MTTELGQDEESSPHLLHAIKSELIALQSNTIQGDVTTRNAIAGNGALTHFLIFRHTLTSRQNSNCQSWTVEATRGWTTPLR